MKNFSVTKNFKYFAIVSILLVAVGLFALLAAPFGLNLFNMDIDFTGGTTFTYDMGQQVTGDTVQQIQQAVGDIVGATPSVVTTGDGTQVMIKTHDLDSETRDALHQAMVDTFGLEDSARQDVQNVSPSVGKDMQAAESLPGGRCAHAAVYHHPV